MKCWACPHTNLVYSRSRRGAVRGRVRGCRVSGRRAPRRRCTRPTQSQTVACWTAWTMKRNWKNVIFLSLLCKWTLFKIVSFYGKTVHVISPTQRWASTLASRLNARHRSKSRPSIKRSEISYFFENRRQRSCPLPRSLSILVDHDV